MDAAAIPRMVWTPQHTPNMGPWTSMRYDPALAFGVAHRFLHMSVGVFSYDLLCCRCIVLLAFIISWPEHA
jgi:hypothetical protein